MQAHQQAPTLEHGIPTRPAASERSPNRKPRYKSCIRQALTHAEQDTFIRVYREYGFPMAIAAIQRTGDTIIAWARSNPEFQERWCEVQRIRKTLLDGPRNDVMTDKALTVVEEVMDTDDAKLALDAAKLHLQGTGVYSPRDRHEQAQAQTNVLIVNVIGGGADVLEGIAARTQRPPGGAP